MTEAQEKALVERIERLEAAVANIQDILDQSQDITDPQQDLSVRSSVAKTDESITAAAQPTAKAPVVSDRGSGSEYWLNKIGIGLLLLSYFFQAL